MRYQRNSYDILYRGLRDCLIIFFAEFRGDLWNFGELHFEINVSCFCSLLADRIEALRLDTRECILSYILRTVGKIWPKSFTKKIHSLTKKTPQIIHRLVQATEWKREGLIFHVTLQSSHFIIKRCLYNDHIVLPVHKTLLSKWMIL